MIIFIKKESRNPGGSTEGRDKEKSSAKEKNHNAPPQVPLV